MSKSILVLLLAIGLWGAQARAQVSPFDSPVIYAATGPAIFGVSPGQQLPGRSVTITGQNFKNVLGVSLGPGNPVESFSVVSPTQITAVIPTIPNIGVTEFPVMVRTAAGSAASQQDLIYMPGANVPLVIGLALSTAEQMITQAELVVGSIRGPTAANSVVTGESPNGGFVAVNTPVSLTTRAALTGFRSLTLVNNLASEDPAYVMIYDYLTGYAVENGGQLLGFGDVTTFNLTTGHSYSIYAVDPYSPNCPQPTPLDTNCVPWELPGPINGDQNGTAAPTIYMQ